MTEQKAHSALGASSMYRWKACPGSIRLCNGIPNPPGQAAMEGTRIHELVEKYMNSLMSAEEFWKLDEKTQNSIRVYSETIFKDQYKKYPDPDNRCELYIEHRFDLSSVYDGCFGTADAVLWDPHLRRIYVYDYKNGTGVVEVENNDQLQYYALGAFKTLNLTPSPKDVEIVVVQPNATHKKGNVRRWRFPVAQLLDFEIELVDYAEKTADPNAPLVAGRHCYFCAAKNSCPARRQERLGDAVSRFSEIADNDDPFC